MLSAEMANWQTIFAKMNTLATSHASLIVLRAMLVHEAVRDEGPRDMVVYRIVARHERISTRLRLDALAEVMPALKTGLRRTPLSH